MVVVRLVVLGVWAGDIGDLVAGQGECGVGQAR